MSLLTTFLAALIWIPSCLVIFGSTPAETQLTGDWKGTSICTVKNSPCHDESVVYHVAAMAEKPGWFSIQADRIVDGKPVNMGTLECSYSSTAHLMTCEMDKGKWQFAVDRDKMTGTLHLTDGTLFRRVEVQKQH